MREKRSCTRKDALRDNTYYIIFGNVRKKYPEYTMEKAHAVTTAIRCKMAVAARA